jgi:hypothetical protein
MSTVNAANMTTGRYNPPSAERKLEKQLAQAKASMNSLSAIPGNWKVKKDPKLGTHYVLMMGEDGVEHVNHFVIHRLIGQDYQIDAKNAWVMSLASDITGFQDAAEFSGKPKVVKLLRALKDKTAVESGAIKIDSEGLIRYPNGDNREEALKLARESSDAHAKVSGGKHFGEWILYLPPDLVQAEMKIQSSTSGNQKYSIEVNRILGDYAIYQTSLIDKKRQQEVPYLYGVPEKDVLRTVYSALFGLTQPKEKSTEFHSGIFPHKVYSDYMAGDDPVRQNLVRLVQIHAETRKEFNIAKSELDAAKVKDKKTELFKVFEAKKSELDDITIRVLAAEEEGRYPSIKADTRYELTVNSQKSPEQARQSLAKIEQLANTSKKP